MSDNWKIMEHEIGKDNHHHHVLLLAWISLTLSHHSSLSSIASGRSPRRDLMSIQNCCRSVVVGHLTLACLCVGVYWRTPLMSPSLLLQQYPACLVWLIWMVLEIEDRWSCSCCLVGCCFQDLFKEPHNILEQFLSSFFSIC